MIQQPSKLLALVLAGMVVCAGCEENMPVPAAQADPQTQAPQEEPAGTFSSETIHVGVVVSDLEASVRFYEEVIGMQRVSGFSLDEDFGRRSGLTDGLPLSVEVLQLGTGETATQWKVMSFGDRAAPQANAYISDRLGMQYITLFVTDLQAAIARLEAHNIPLLGETPTPLNDGRHFVLIKDPDDIFIELIGPMSS